MGDRDGNLQDKNNKSDYDKNCDDIGNEYQQVETRSNTQSITSKEINIKSLLDSINNTGDYGATVLFIGTVRNYGNNGRVTSMRYESYVGMAEEKIRNIEDYVKDKWDAKEIRIVHRIGDLNVGDNSIAIAICTPHSKDAFEACQFILDKIKQDVPIWKNERLLGGETKWVKGKRMQQQ
jgi:molybdopterin synthase catalytic subunit